MIVEKFNMKKYNILQNNVNGQLIKHCHFHLIEANDSGFLSTKDSKSISMNDQEYTRLVQIFKQEFNNNA